MNCNNAKWKLSTGGVALVVIAGDSVVDDCFIYIPLRDIVFFNPCSPIRNLVRHIKAEEVLWSLCLEPL